MLIKIKEYTIAFLSGIVALLSALLFFTLKSKKHVERERDLAQAENVLSGNSGKLEVLKHEANEAESDYVTTRDDYIKQHPSKS